MKSDENEIRQAIRAQEILTARAMGCLVAVSEILTGKTAPDCFDPEPEIIAHQVAELKRERDELRAEVERLREGQA